MQTILVERLKSYITEYNPELLDKLHADCSVGQYLEDKVHAVMPVAAQMITDGKPQFIIEELCLAFMTRALRPSRYCYVKSLLEQEFLTHYESFREKGVLRFELLNLLDVCNSVFDRLHFSEENKGDRFLRYATISMMYEYLNNTSHAE